MTLNLFYEEPDLDRWLPMDRYPRLIIRRIIRGKPRPGGQMRVFLNLCAGLDKLGIQYRVNDYRYIQRHPDELACIIGKPFLLDKIRWQNPILFGAAVYSHPLDDSELFKRLRIQTVLVPGEWMRKMCEPYWGDQVVAWPVGIDTERWKPMVKSGNAKNLKAKIGKPVDFLIYDKVRWEHDRYEVNLIQPIRSELKKRGLSFQEVRYGLYREEAFEQQLHQCKAMIFLCEHETQGIAYQQALACGVPILAWDRGGYWQDTSYYPERVKFEPVSSVPYWDGRCGSKFMGIAEFSEQLRQFLAQLDADAFNPREYILQNLTLEKCAQEYLNISREICLNLSK